MSHHKDLDVEECPLQNHRQCQKRPSTIYKGPLRVIRLCVLGIILPALFIALPLYMRFRVYGHQLYPLAMSDMRLLDNKISTTWCQRQLVRVNTTFNAFLLKDRPTLSPLQKPLTMTRHLVLEDDVKEYWGFYLLQGSSVTVSTCVRWPGASLIVIRGHKHLHECAYIGDNSSEELDELMEAIREGAFLPPREDAPANQPEQMERYRDGVQFHHPGHQNRTNSSIHQAIDTSDIHDPKLMQTILDALQAKSARNYRRRVPDGDEPHPHIVRTSTFGKDETKNFRIQAPANANGKTHSQEAYEDIVGKLNSLGKRGETLLREINKKFAPSVASSNDEDREQVIDMKGRQYSKPLVNFDENIDRARRRRRDIRISAPIDANELTSDDEKNDLAAEEGFHPDGIADHRGRVNETTNNDYSNSEFWSSFSSSEEALLNCAGLILNLPLTPHHKCNPNLTEAQAEETFLANTITYKVPVNGYYFFVFNSENEVQPNYIRVQFHLKKSVYNVTEVVSSCINSTEQCALKLNFFSSEKVVMELPVKENDTLWNEEFVVVSECEPRTAVYVMCVVAVPVLVILFAFS